MNQLTEFLVNSILEEDKNEIIGIYGGGFKPPIKGHLEVLQGALDQYPEMDKVIVSVGSGVRDEIDQEESLLVWDIYQRKLPIKVEIGASKSGMPIKDIYKLAEENPDKTIYWIIGAREGREDDLQDIAKRTAAIDKAEDKYNNVEVKVIKTADPKVSGTNARKALIAGNKEEFFTYLPDNLTDEEKEEIFSILRPAVKETDNPDDGKASPYGSGYGKVNENASYSKDIDIQGKIDQLTQHMIDKGYNIEPLPGLEFVDGDTENARDFFGKTAYYDPINKVIVLYTEGRHPKDIARSYAHEMIHHIQNLEGRLDNITTTNTQEDDYLNDIEAEANLKGTMTFRNWTDSLNEIGDASAAKLEWNPAQIEKIAKEIERKISNQEEDTVEYYDMLPVINVISYESRTRYRVTVDASVDKPEDELAMTTLRVDFTTEEGGDDAINKGEQYKILATLTDIIIQLITRVNEIDSTTLDLVKFYAKDDTEGKYANPDSKRGKLYQAFINKNLSKLPGDWKMSTSDEVIMLSPIVNEGFNKKLGKDPFGLNQFARELMAEGAYDSLVNKLTKQTINQWKKDLAERNPKSKKKSTSFIDLDIDEVDTKGRELEFNFLGLTEFNPKIDGYVVNGTSNSGEEKNKIPFVATLFEINPKILPQAWSKIYMDVADVIRHEIEHLTQAGPNLRSDKYMEDDIDLRDMINKLKILPKKNYYLLQKEVDAMLQGLYFKAKKSKKPFADVIDNYLDMAPGIETKEDKELILNLWRSRRGALSLPVFENKEEVMDYKIFLDMDGVLVNFDKQFKELTGEDPRTFETKYGTEGFWEAIEKAGVGFWRGMEWMDGGEALYNRASQHDHALLSSPSRSETSKIGKRLWRRDKTPDTKLILARSYNKRKYAAPNHILIDDRADNIQQWKDAGGIGILYTSADQVNKELDKLGL
ncbi:hypothetical protein OAA18_00505 [bacterium]|nr:hypothetical protein [bacterium]